MNSPAQGYRKSLYLRQVTRSLLAAGLNKKQQSRVMEAGWTKVKEYGHLLTPGNFERWTHFALKNPIEVVQQAARVGKPSAPPERSQIKAVLFRVSKPLRTALIDALEKRGWRPEKGKKGGRKSSVEPALERLLIDSGDLPPP